MMFIQVPFNSSQTGLSTGAKKVPLIQSFTSASLYFRSYWSLASAAVVPLVAVEDQV